MKKILLAIILFCATGVAVAQNNRSMYVTLKSGEVREIACEDIDSISFKSSTTTQLNLNAPHAFGAYYGDSYLNGNGIYVIRLSDKEIDNNGLASEDTQTLLQIGFVVDKAEDSSNATLASGSYKFSTDNTQKNSLYVRINYINESTEAHSNDKTTNTMKVFSNCYAEVVNKGNNQYSIKFTGILADEPTSVNYTYDGEIIFANGDPAYYTPLNEDVTVVPEAMSGYFFQTGAFSAYSLALSNTYNAGYYSVDGEIVDLELLTELADEPSVENLVGTYTVAMSNTDSSMTGYEPGKFIGSRYEYNQYYGMYIPTGSYYNMLDEEGYDVCYGMFVDGTVTITVNGDNVVFNADLITAQGKHVKIENYETNLDNVANLGAGYSKQPKMKRKAVSLVKQ